MSGPRLVQIEDVWIAAEQVAWVSTSRSLSPSFNSEIHLLNGKVLHSGWPAERVADALHYRVGEPDMPS